MKIESLAELMALKKIKEKVMPNLDEYKQMADLLFPNITKTPQDYYKMYPARNLPEGAEVTRFAPSPTGYMHIGGVYQCLINSFVAHQTEGGVFFLRNEDTDSKREVAGASNIFIPALKGFGIVPDEGFVSDSEEKGAYGPYTQSKRKEIYQAFAKDLVARGLAYPCFCEGENKEAKEEQLRLGMPLGYYGSWAKCRNLSYEEVEEKVKAGKKFTIRIKANGDGVKKFKFKDLRIGETLLPVNYNDYVLLKSDGLALYHLAHLVDDTLMHTTTVIRDESWFPSAPLHIQLFEYMGLTPPKYLHTPTINTLDAETGNARKVSKRKDNWADSRWFHEKGYPKEAIIEYLTNIINSNFEPWREQNPTAPFSEFKFSIKNMSKSGALFDLAKLDNISKNIVSRMSGEEVYQNTLMWAKNYAPEKVELLEKYADYAVSVFGMDKNEKRPRKDITTFSEVLEFYSYMFDEAFNNQVNFDVEKLKKSDIKLALEHYLDNFNIADNKDEWFARMKSVAGEIGFATDMKAYKANPENYKGSIADFSGIIRVALTGRTQTPDLFAIINLLGDARVKQRLASAITSL